MSFSSDVKIELCKQKASDCCEYAELYGIFLLSRSFSNSDIFYYSDRKEITNKCASLIKSVYGIKVEHCMFNGNYALKSDIISVGKIYADFIMVDFITDVFNCDVCFEAFIRGAFISGGSITDPNKSLHAEIKTQYETVGISLLNLLKSRKINAHLSKRSNYHIVYFKGNENISDLLALMGASRKALEVIDVGLIKEMRNKVNRIKNCETANIGKTVDASIKQTKAIKKLKKHGMLETLPDELRIIANLRLENPEMSLGELAKNCALSRSGINHRLNKLISISEKIEEVKK